MNIAVFLDRDGTINEEMGYVNHPSRFQLLPASVGAIARLNQAGIKVVLVTNQSGVARGYFPSSLMDQIHQHLQQELRQGGAYLDGIYVCQHSPDAGCACRKPRAGLLQQAAQEMDIDLKRSFVVGDRYIDIELAANAGARGILVLTGYGRGELEYYQGPKRAEPVYIAADLGDAARWILAEVKKY
ncbi:MAG: D-glycero-beta-D-manno-heptose-1,7-bisphosphate 7-phosphatase [Desulfobacca sp. 4484_104]|nr:MAG: D-glycero-beta-D-manno-heptose-1,7-bisphosphate 7-phosphatase [Desulfobacca sp. 4484_104]RLA87702.1 MAG: D-glycero-beta-D-manno-heptose-1,7-bisphosphate 7-phosphatase [Deltaproteobacteria bacterium]